MAEACVSEGIQTMVDSLLKNDPYPSSLRRGNREGKLTNTAVR